MKKGLTFAAVTAVGLAAVATPVAQADASAITAGKGFYDTVDNQFYTVAEFQQLSSDKKAALITKDGFYLHTGTQVISGKDAALSTNDVLITKLINAADFDAADLDAIYADSQNPGGEPTELAVESVSAINKTTVKLVLSKEVDSVTAANFSVEGGNVTAASLAEDKKTVTLSVSGLTYDTEYTVAVTEILVDGTPSDFGSKAFTTPAVTDLWELQISTLDANLIADGSDNTEVTFKLVDKATGEVDKAADNVVLDLNTTYGTLASKRVTVQDGVATVLLTSEFSNTDISAKIDAQIIEASGDYKDLINHVFGTALVPFKTTTTDNVETITLVSAEANQADRVTLFFDKEVNLKHFVKTNAKGELLYSEYDSGGVLQSDSRTAKYLTDNKVAPELITHTLINVNNIKLSQEGNTNFDIKGLKPVAGNSKAIEVILDKETVLKDNAEVKIDVVTVNSIKKETPSTATFTVTDARKPEATSVATEGLNTLKVKFSEAIADATFQIDGQFKGLHETDAGAAAAKAATPATQAGITAAEAFTYEFGEFNPVTLADNRDLATITLTKNYWETGDKKLSGYFGAGQHTVQVSSTEDFAFVTDPNNMGSTQNLNFNIAADSAKPTATVKVESPEQIRVTFDKAISLVNAAAFEALFTSDKAVLQYLDTASGEYKDVATRVDADGANFARIVKDNFKFTRVSASEYLIELKDDWTTIYDTDTSNKNYYNDKYRIVIAKDSVTNVANGLKNEEIKLDLNYSGSPLNSPDTTSPVISNIERVGTTANFNVTMSEPVKLKGHVGSNETKAQGQTDLQVTTVQFLGKDKDGNAVTINGRVIGYADSTTTKGDKVLNVAWDKYVDGSGVLQTNTVTPQTVVDDGGSDNWTLVVRSISDDVGNTAASATKDFKVEKSPAGDTPFFVEKYIGGAKDGKHKVEGKGNGTGKDTVVITFTEGVQFSGNSDATNPANYTLNGVTLPTGTSIAVSDKVNDTASAPFKGLETVTITLPDGTLNIGANVSNVITINKNLVSHDGSKIEGDTTIIVNVDENIDLANLATAQSEADALTVSYNGTDALVTLPTTTANGTVAWVSDNAAINATNGAVTRPAYDFDAVANADDVVVNLTPDVTVNGQTATAAAALPVTVKAETLDETTAGTATSNYSLVTNATGLDITGIVTAGLVTDAGTAITANIGDFTITGIPAGTDVTLKGANAANDDDTQSIELTAAGLLTGTGLSAGDVFDVTVTITDAAGNSTDVVLTITVTA